MSQPASSVQAVPPKTIRRPSPSPSPISFHSTGGGATSGSTTPSSILLNKPKPLNDGGANSPGANEKSIDAMLSGYSLPTNRVSSPDGNQSDASAGAFSDQSSAANTITAPSSTFSSPGLKPIPLSEGGALNTMSASLSPALTSINDPTTTPAASSPTAPQHQQQPVSQLQSPQPQQQGDYFKNSRSSSPHCHFAPLPKVDQDRPITRRNSNAQSQSSSSTRVKPFVTTTSARDSPVIENHDEPFHLEMGEQLGSALHNLSTQQGRNSPSWGRRASSVARSGSPSPSRKPSLSRTSSQPHSPAMSRHASSDAMNVHYIQGSKIGATSPILGTHPRDRDESGSRERERNENERERELQIEMARIKEREAWKEEREAAARDTGAISPDGTTARVPSTPGLEGSSEGLVKKPKFIEPPATERIKPLRKNTNEEVVEIEPGQEASAADSELEEVEEEDEDDVDGAGNDDDEDEDDENDDQDEDDDEKKEEDDDDEEVEDETEVRATARGAAVEVVHWHRSESPTGEEEEE